MIWPFKKRFAPSDAVQAVYDAIVAQSRQPVFYAEWGVPDTLTGRFDMISLHLALVLRRLRQAERKAFAQDLFDLFFMDMDRSLREMGVGDLSVPKRIEKLGTMFYGLLEKLTEALDAGNSDEVAAVLHRNVLGAEAPAKNAALLATYTSDLADSLAGQAPEEIAKGHVELKAVA